MPVPLIGLQGSLLLFTHAAFFVFSPTAARTWIVTPRFRLPCCTLRHPFGFKGLSSPEGGHLHGKRPAVGEKTFIARTQVVQPRFAVRRMKDTIFRAPAIAHIPDLARQTQAGQAIQFDLPESPLGRAFQKLDQRRFPNIPKAMFRVDVVITRIEVPIVFDDGHITASPPKDTQ